jgi:hypothetical protein
MAKAPEKRKCLNPECPNDGFVARRSDQLHCDGCKNKRHNARRKHDKENRFRREGILRRNAKRLEIIFKMDFFPDGVPAAILKHEQIDLLIYTDNGRNEITGGTIYWSHDFGIEIISKLPKLYKVHHRKSN